MLISKKLTAFLSCLIIILSTASLSLAADYRTVNAKGKELADSVAFLGRKIIMSNKHSLQVSLTRDDRTYEHRGRKTVSPYTLNRVWAKDGTIVCGCAKKDKKFDVEHLITNDPKMFFAGGIHVGDGLEVFQEFIGVHITEAAEICDEEDSGWGIELSNTGGTVTWDSAPENADSLVIYFNKQNVITQIEYFSNKTYLPVSNNAQEFVISKIKELGIF